MPRSFLLHPAVSLGVVVVMLASCVESATPYIDPEILVLGGCDVDVVVNGLAFGSAGDLVIGRVIVPSTRTTWTSERIDLHLSPCLDDVGAASPTDRTIFDALANGAPGLVVRTPDLVASAAVVVQIFGTKDFAVHPTAGTDASPVAVALADNGDVYVNEELHRAFHVLTPRDDPATGAPAEARALPPMPLPPDPGPFASFTDDVDERTQASALGEDVVVDGAGFVWFTEGGARLYEQGAFPNHSRIVRFDPSTSSYRVYNVPGDRNEVIGLAVDDDVGLVWFCEGGRGRITRMNPEEAAFDTASPSFDFSTDADDTGYTFFDVGDDGAYPAFPLLDDDGHVWFTAFLGNEIGRLDPGTGVVELFPLPPPRATTGPGALFASGGPWRIAFDPDRSHVAFAESFDFEISRIAVAQVRAGDPACQALDAGHHNECVQSVSIAGAEARAGDDVAAGTRLVHSIAYDADGRLWFTEPGPPGAVDDRVGFVTADFAHSATLSGAFGAPRGLAVDAAGNLWFAASNGHTVTRLSRAFR